MFRNMIDSNMTQVLDDNENYSLLLRHGFIGEFVNSLNSDGETSLFVAIHYNYGMDIVRALLSAKADVNAKNLNGGTPLFAAVKNGNLAIVEELLSAGASVNMSKPSLFYEAVSNSKDVNMIRSLIQAGANVNAKNVNGETPLYAAVKNGKLAIVEELLSGGASVNMSKSSVLYKAISDGKDVNMIRLLVQAGANVNAKNVNGETPLYAAVKNGKLAIVKELLSGGASVNMSKSSVLYEAVSDGKSVNIIRALIRAGADVNYKKNLINMLHIVSEADTAKELLLHGAEVNYKNALEETPLHTVIKKRRNIRVVEALLRGGADVSACNKDGDTPIFVAVRDDNLLAVKTLVSSGSSINVTNDFNETPLYEAIAYRREDIFVFLLNQGSNLNSRDGNTLLHIATTSLIAWHLLRCGIDANARNDLGQTPLHINAIEDDDCTRAIVRELLRNGAEVNAVDFKGNTPLHFALFSLSRGIIELLVENGADIHIENCKDSSLKPHGSPLTLAKSIVGNGYATGLIKTSMLRKISYNASEILGPKAPKRLIIYFNMCLNETLKMKQIIMSDNRNLYDFLRFDFKIDLENLYKEYKYIKENFLQPFPIYRETIMDKMKNRIEKEKRLVAIRRLQITTLSKDGKKLIVLSHDCMKKFSAYMTDDVIQKFLVAFDISVKELW